MESGRHISKARAMLFASCAVLVLMLCLGAPVGLSLFMHEPGATTDRPKFTDWLQAWGSVGGIGAGLLAAGAAGWLLLVEIRNARTTEYRYQAERAEAALAAPRAVLVTRVHSGVVDEPVGPDFDVERLTVAVSNFGPHPVRRIIVTVRLDDRRATFPVIGTVAPNATEQTQITHSEGAEVGDQVGEIVIRFLDLVGQEWERVDGGEPQHPVVPLPPPYPVR